MPQQQSTTPLGGAFMLLASVEMKWSCAFEHFRAPLFSPFGPDTQASTPTSFVRRVTARIVAPV